MLLAMLDLCNNIISKHAVLITVICLTVKLVTGSRNGPEGDFQ